MKLNDAYTDIYLIVHSQMVESGRETQELFKTPACFQYKCECLSNFVLFLSNFSFK